MRDILDQFGRTIRSIFEDDRHSWDGDMQDAWQELNSFLDQEDAYRQHNDQTYKQNQYRPQSQPQTDLSKDYKNLELKPGSTTPEVKKAYKRLLSLYHPDRHAGDPGKQRLATEITSRLNDSYKRIMDQRASE